MFTTCQPGNRVAAFDDCCKDINVYQKAVLNADGTAEYAYRANRCHDRLCGPCAALRSAEITRCLMGMLQGKPHTFITLTLSGKNQTLTELLDRLYKHFRALRQHPLWAENVKGGAAFLEIKWNDKVRRWHPHLHIVADAGFIDQGKLSDAWRSITNDSFIVDIRRIRNEGVVLRYVTKYASKPLNMSFARDESLLQQAVLALKGRRLCLTFGTFYGTPLTDAEDANLDDADWMKDPYGSIHVGTAVDLGRRMLRGENAAAAILRKLRLVITDDRTTDRPPDKPVPSG